MSSLKLYGSTSGYVEIVPEATAGNNSVTLPSGSGTLVTQDGSGNITITGRASVPLGSASSPSIYFDDNTGIYSPGADQLAIATGGTGRLFIDSSGKVEVSKATGSATLSPTEFFISSTTDANDWNTTNPWARLAFYSADTTNGARTRVAIDAVQQFSNGNVSSLSFKTDNGSGTLVERQRISYTGTTTLTSAASTEPLIVKIDASEVARIDSSGRLLVGTSSSRSNWFNATNADPLFQLESASNTRLSITRNDNTDNPGELLLGNSRSSAYAVVSNSDNLGRISFQGADGSEMVAGAYIQAFVDGTPGANDMPGRLVFSTTADGASSPTERMRIDSNGAVEIFANIRPRTDNTTSLGTASRRWSVVYAATGSINTSDATLKQDIEELDAAELSVATAIKGLIKKFRFTDAVSNKGDDARIHVGVIAQEIEQAFVAAGLDSRRYGMFCEDTLEDGTKRLGIRYDELLTFVIAAL